MNDPIELLPNAKPKSNLNKLSPKKTRLKRPKATIDETVQSPLRPIDNAIFRNMPELLISNRQNQYDEEYFIKVADNLIWWVDNDKRARDLTQFCAGLGVSRSTFTSWAQRWPVLGKALTYAKDILSWNRDLSASMGEMNPSIVNITRHLYSDEYNSEEDRKAILITKAKAEAAQPAKVEVNIRELTSDVEVELVDEVNLH